MTAAVIGRRYAASLAGEVRDGGLVYLRLSGPITPDSLRHFAADGLRRYGPEATAYVLDMRTAILGMTAEEWRDMVLPIQAGAKHLPGAIVCGSEVAKVMRAYAFDAAKAGHFKRVFLTVPPAAQWAARMAREFIPPVLPKAASGLVPPASSEIHRPADA